MRCQSEHLKHTNLTPSLWDIMPTIVFLWTPVEGEELTTIMEPTNIQDKFAVAVKNLFSTF